LSLCLDAEDWLTLSFLPGLGCSLINRLVQEAGTPAAVLRAGAPVKNIPGVGPRLFNLLTDGHQVASARQRAQREMDQLAALNVSLLSLSSPEYPDSLRSLIARCCSILAAISIG
jgi:DNA processing protein